MALDTEPTPATLGSKADDVLITPWDRMQAATARLLRRLKSDQPLATRVAGWLARSPVARFVSANLWRRIFIANMMSLLIVLLGFHFFWPEQKWVIDAKRDSLKTQGEIIAAAIAANATVDAEGMALDAYKLPDGEISRAPYRDDGFAALELSIRPERVTPVLRRLIQPTKTRARIYAKDGTMIVDSAALISRGQFGRDPPVSARPKTKNFWTRLTAWLIDKELPVYTEIGSANGTAYPEVKTALAGKPAELMLLTDRGDQIVSVAIPITRRNAVQGALLLSTRPGDIDNLIGDGRSVLWTLFGIALLATLGTTFLLAKTVAEPMRRLSEAADHVSHNITARQELPDYGARTDEVGQMATAFKAMTAALYRRIEASENFAADVAHELKNPLAAARSTVESLGYAKSPEQRDQLVQQIQFELRRLNRLISDVSNASRLDAELARQKSKPFNLIEVLESVTQIFRDILTENSRRVSLVIENANFDGSYLVNGDDGRMGQVITNLVDNAISFSPENGVVTVRARHQGSKIEIFVDDEGPGIPPNSLEIVFDRFYSDRPATEATRGKNSGLGLSISREIVRAHSGEIWAENRLAPDAAPGSPPIGARFVVRLPAISQQSRGGSTFGRRA